jgi:hypothetical protein
MHRIDSTTAKANKFGAGKSGFTEGTPGVEAATETTDDWFDGVQEEIITPIEDMGFSLAKGTRTQLWTAIKRGMLANMTSLIFRHEQDVNFSNAALNAIACDEANKRWVAVGGLVGGDALMMSSGVTSTYGNNAMVFEEIANPVAQGLNGVAYNGSNLWVAVGDDNGVNPYICTSPNGGAPWTQRTPAVAAAIDLNDVAYNGSNLWVAVGDVTGTNPYILSSPDGITWTARTIAVPVNVQLNSVCHDQSGLWVAVGEVTGGTDPLIVTSPDGITWTTRTPTVAHAVALNEVRYDSHNGKFIAVGDLGAGGFSSILHSSDGVTWTKATTQKVNVNLFGLAISDTGVAVTSGEISFGGFTQDFIIVSLDGGITWSAHIPVGTETASGGYLINGIGYGNGMFLMVTDNSGTDGRIYKTGQVVAGL